MMMICIATVDGDVDDADDDDLQMERTTTGTTVDGDVNDAVDADDDDLQMERTTTTGAGLPKGPFTASQLAPSSHQHHNCK